MTHGFETALSKAKIGSSLKQNHQSQVKIVQIAVPHGIIITVNW